MQIEVSSFFQPGKWEPVDYETFERMVCPSDEAELGEMLEALENGQCVLSAFKTLKFRAASTTASPVEN